MSANLIYSEWREDNKHILEGLAGNNIISLFSGGKDSSVVMHFLLKAGQEFEFDFESHAAAFPAHRYTDAEKNRIESYWQNRGKNITWNDVSASDDDLRKSENPCYPCQEVRKKLLKSFLTGSIEDWNRLVLIVSYSLSDIVSYAVEYLLGDIFSNNVKREGAEESKRYKETAQRFYPLLKMKEGYSVFRPLIKLNNDDILNVIEQENIPILSIPCEFKDYRPKRILQNYYQRMDLRFEYNQLFEFAKNSLDLPDISSYSGIEKEEYLHRLF
jgi:tRNA(Ile)-lysidine synthase TilS/MesJ